MELKRKVAVVLIVGLLVGAVTSLSALALQGLFGLRFPSNILVVIASVVASIISVLYVNRVKN